ncbi:hypothetical protein BDF21DRAFT_243522 [Thamnidium elegans]|nr:hypothetical protein BDF21DRAFT_243522 [Thamnidium elegans]
MTSAKAIQIAKDIDASRCSGNWLAITELARRYKKYNPDGAEQTVLAEANLIQIITATRSKNVVTYEADAPHRVSMEDRLNPEQLKSIQDQLQAAIELSDPNNLHAIEKNFARIVLARTYFECGQYETAVNIISQLSFEMDHVKQGYGLVLFLQARVIKAISFELTGNEDAAIQSYVGVEALLSENPNAKSKSFIEWSEEALYRAVLVGLREGLDHLYLHLPYSNLCANIKR